MPAVYAIDLIAKRDKKIKMDRSIIKGWNVHYQTLEEVEEASRMKRKKEEEEEHKARKQKEAEKLNEGKEEERLKEAYNEKTGSYSGTYGRKPVNDEGQKQQIHAILNEKPEPFEYAMSALAEQDTNS